MTEASRMMKLMKGFKLLDMDIEVVTVGGMLSPRPVGISPKAGLLEFNTVGGAPVPGIATPVVDDVVGTSTVPGVGIYVTGDDVEVVEFGKMQEPVLGFELVITAVPPKSQLVCVGFF